MGLHAVLGLQNVVIDGALSEEADLVANLAGLLLEHANELGTDDFTLGLGLFDIDELAQEAIGGINIGQVRVHLVFKDIDDLFTLALAHKAVVHMHADKLLANSLNEQRRNNRTVDATGKSQQDFLVADLLVDCSDLLVDERLGKFGGGDTHHVVGTLVGIHAGLLFGPMEMRREAQAARHESLIYAAIRRFSCHRQRFAPNGRLLFNTTVKDANRFKASILYPCTKRPLEKATAAPTCHYARHHSFAAIHPAIHHKQ